MSHLYNSFVFSYLIYGVEVWGNTNAVHLDPIIKIQNKIVRTITFSHYLAHTEPIFDTLNILNFNKWVVHRIGLMMFKYSKDLVPLPIVEFLTKNYEFHNYYTRQSQLLHTAVGRNKAIYKTFTFHGIRIWNYILTKISVDVSYASFKHSSKLLIQNNSIPEYPSNTIVMCFGYISMVCYMYVVCMSSYYISNLTLFELKGT